MTVNFEGASLQVLNAAEEFRHVLNLLRKIDIRDDARDRLAARSRLLAARLEAFGVNANALLHDRNWAIRPVPGATFSSLEGECQPRRRIFPD